MMQRLIYILPVLLCACSLGFQTAPTPNLYREGTNYPEDQVPQALRTVAPDIFFVTNRAEEAGRYGRDRSSSMAFGSARIKFGEDLSWTELLDRTRADSNAKVSSLWVTEVAELVRFPETPLPYARQNDRLLHLPEARSRYDAQARAFQAAVRDKIRQTGNRRLLVYIHGFNNEFEDSLTTLANLWHFSGRTSVPISFTWPAGNGPGLLGYFRDRDSGTFSVHHTKEFLRMLGEIPEVSEIDIVAHSRGTDVATTALRELILEARASGAAPKQALKLGILIMAAPDLDVDIVRQRLAAERFSEGFEQMNLYINPDDAALRLSAFLTRSNRLGALRNEDFLPGEVEILSNEARVNFIRVENMRNKVGHAYFRDNPAVISDIVLSLRTRAAPGAALRPLERDAAGIWVLHPNYPLDRLPDLTGFAGAAARSEER